MTIIMQWQTGYPEIVLTETGMVFRKRPDKKARLFVSKDRIANWHELEQIGFIHASVRENLVWLEQYLPASVNRVLKPYIRYVK